MMLTIRKACLKDYQTIVTIMRKSATEEELAGFVPPEGIAPKFLRELKVNLKREKHGIIIAEIDAVPVGFAYYCFRKDSVEIEEVDVVKPYQGQGIGKTLVQHIENAAKEKRLAQLVTGTSVNEEGKPWRAYGFWSRMGFIDTGERIDGPHGLKYVRLVKKLHPLTRKRK